MGSLIRRLFSLGIPDLRQDFGNPFIRYHAGRNAGRRSERVYTPRQVRRLLFVLTLFFVAVPLLFVVGHVGNPRTYQYAWYSPINGAINTFIQLAFGVSAITDLYVLVTTVNFSGLHTNKGKWEDIQVTGISPERVIQGTYQVALARAWPICALEMAFRSTLITLIVSQGVVNELSYNVQNPPGSAIINLVVLLPILAALYFEPLWRTKYVVSFALRLAARSRDITTLIFVYIRAFIYLRLMQFIILFGYATLSLVAALILSRMIQSFYSAVTAQNNMLFSPSGIVDEAIVSVTIVIVVLLIRRMYRKERMRVLEIAARDLFRRDDDPDSPQRRYLRTAAYSFSALYTGRGVKSGSTARK